MIFVSEGMKELGEDMVKNPKNWRQAEYNFEHREHADISFWTANGIFGLKMDGGVDMGLFERIYILRCIKKSLAQRAKEFAETLNEEDKT